jgi:hypothetical protein
LEDSLYIDKGGPAAVEFQSAAASELACVISIDKSLGPNGIKISELVEHPTMMTWFDAHAKLAYEQSSKRS